MEEYERYVSQAEAWVERLVGKAGESQEIEIYAISPAEATHADGKIIYGTDQKHIEGFPILGQRKLIGSDAVGRLAQALVTMIAKRPKESALCFEPRHAVRLRLSRKNYFILICFTCSAAHVFREGSDGLQEIELPIAKELEPVFDRLFSEQGLPKAP